MISLLDADSEFYITLGIFLFSCVAVVVLSILQSRPRKTLMPSMIPLMPITMIFGFIGLLALVHLANLYGIHTGNRPRL